MGSVDFYPSPLSFDDERFKFLSAVWSKSLEGEQMHPSYVSRAPKHVLKCENLSIKIPFRRKCLSIKRALKTIKPSRYDRFESTDGLVLLDKVNAEIQGGEILAVLGPSGAGKTLFLSALLGVPSVKGGEISGKVYLNGLRLRNQTESGSVAFVPQKDLAVDTLTIEEHLRFAASLRLWRESKQMRTARINELLVKMNLEKCRRCELRSLSNGERKRVSIATQMVVRPAVLLLDEPLTGLDATVADTIIAVLARVAQPTPSSPHGCAVVCVLHQPRPQTLRFVSKVMLLTDGRVAFYGTPNETEQFYYRLNPTSETKYGAWNSILESFMESLHMPNTADYIVDSYRNGTGNGYQRNSRDSMKLMATPPLLSPIIRAPWRTQLKWLIWRETMDAKHVKLFDLSTYLFMLTGVIIGLWYANSDERNPAGVQTASGLLFMVSSEIIYTNAYSMLNSFSPQISILLREKRLYGPSAYYLSKVIGVLPRATLQSVLFACAVHLSGNLSGDGGLDVFLPIVGVLVIVGIAATSYGCMLAGVSSSVEKAYVVAQPLDIIANSLGGIFGTASNNVFHLDGLKYLSSFFYSFEILSILYWGSVKKFDCAAYFTSPCPTSESVLAQTGFASGHLTRNIMLLCVYIIVCNSVGFLGTWIRFQKHTVY